MRLDTRVLVRRCCWRAAAFHLNAVVCGHFYETLAADDEQAPAVARLPLLPLLFC